MPSLDFPVSNIVLTSTWTCRYVWGDHYDNDQTSATTAQTTVGVKYALPAGAEIYATQVHSVWEGAKWGYAVATVNGKQPASNGMVYLNDTNPKSSSGTYNITFVFKAARDAWDSHASSATSSYTPVLHTTSTTISGIYLRLYYSIVYSACTPPSTVTTSSSSVSPGEKVTLSWSGATAGNQNAIKGYQIYRSTSKDSGYTLLTTVSSSSTAGSATVTAPTENGVTYYYKVLTVGTQSGYNSAQSTAVASVACDFAAVSSPTSVRVASTNVAPGLEVTLEWSGATAGVNNPITGYEIYWAEDAQSDYALLTTIETAETTGSVAVISPANNGETYYFKVRTLGTIEGTDSGLSAVYAALGCTYSAPSAPTRVTINGASNVYILPGTEMTVEWSGAVDGVNNPVTGYTLWQNDVVVATDIAPDATSYTLTAPEDAGLELAFRLVANGTHDNSSTSPSAIAYIYTDPIAPTIVAVSDSAPVAGGRVKLSWSGAKSGAYNEIEAYNVYLSDAVNGVSSRVATVASTSTSGSYYVDVPSREGAHYYFRIETVGNHSNSGVSAVYAEVTIVSNASGAANITVKITPRKRPKKRKFVFGDYDTDEDGKWTLCEWEFPEPNYAESFVDIPGRNKGPLDLTAALTNGDPRYGSRELTARFESSEGTRMEREGIISRMLNRLHGYRKDILLPDDETHYAVGRLSITRDYNDLAHASVTVKATCEPWRYSKIETALDLVADDTERTVVLMNNGRSQVVPEITVSGYQAYVWLTFDGMEMLGLEAGTYKLPGLVLGTGYTKLTYTGSGNIAIRYREAIL